jgi:hypothetical protein
MKRYVLNTSCEIKEPSYVTDDSALYTHISNEIINTTFEKTLCDLFNLENPIRETRYEKTLLKCMTDTPNLARLRKLNLTQHISKQNTHELRTKIQHHIHNTHGEINFIGKNGETYAINTSFCTNTTKIGGRQHSKLDFANMFHFYETYADFGKDNINLKTFITENISTILKSYVKHTFKANKIIYLTGFKHLYEINVIQLNNLYVIDTDTMYNIGKYFDQNESFEFTQTPKNWKESVTIQLIDPPKHTHPLIRSSKDKSRLTIGHCKVSKKGNKITFHFNERNLFGLLFP